MNRNYRIEFAGDPVRWAAWLYYSERRTQNEIARELGVSRQTIANYLNEARDVGLVSVRLSDDLLQSQSIAMALRDRFGLAGVHVLPSLTDEDDLRQRVARAGAEVLCSLAQNGNVIGVSSGRTLSALSQHIPKTSLPEATVIQISGSSIIGTEHSPEACASRVAAGLSARCVNLHAPAYLSSGALANQLHAEPAIAMQFDLIAKSDLIVFGVGELTHNTEIEQPPHLSNAIRDQYISMGAVAVVFGRFLAADGQEQGGPLSDRTIAVSLKTARSIKTRLAVCGGRDKAKAVRAAIHSNLITHMVLDDALAAALLKQEDVMDGR